MQQRYIRSGKQSERYWPDCCLSTYRHYTAAGAFSHKVTPMIQSYMSQHLLPLFWLYLRRYKSIVVCYNYVIAVRVFPLQRLQLHCIQRPCIIDLFLCVNRFLTSCLK